MKECKSCQIQFNIHEDFCPLCQNKLVGHCDKNVFPSNTVGKVQIMLLKLLLFFTLTVMIVSTSLELYLVNRIYISIFVIGGMITNYIIMYYIAKNRRNVLELLGKNGLVFVFLLICWYLYTRQTILTNYIIPGICLLELLFNSVTFIVLRRNYLMNYFKLMVLNMLLLLIPIILILLDFTTRNLLSYICFVFALIIFLGMIIFYFDEFKEELRKYFNV